MVNNLIGREEMVYFKDDPSVHEHLIGEEEPVVVNEPKRTDSTPKRSSEREQSSSGCSAWIGTCFAMIFEPPPQRKNSGKQKKATKRTEAKIQWDVLWKHNNDDAYPLTHIRAWRRRLMVLDDDLGVVVYLSEKEEQEVRINFDFSDGSMKALSSIAIQTPSPSDLTQVCHDIQQYDLAFKDKKKIEIKKAKTVLLPSDYAEGKVPTELFALSIPVIEEGDDEIIKRDLILASEDKATRDSWLEKLQAAKKRK